jgi:hypothetical protein
VDGADDIRTREDQDIAVAAQVLRMVLEALAASAREL